MTRIGDPDKTRSGYERASWLFLEMNVSYVQRAISGTSTYTGSFCFTGLDKSFLNVVAR